MAFLKKHKDFAIYAFFGIITTIANFAVYYPFHNLLHYSGAVSNAIAWFAAVLLAFVTNKPFVFHSRDWSPKVAVPQFLKFIGCRAVSGAVETGLIFLTVDVLDLGGNLMKIIITVAVVVMNYAASKLFIFKNSR